MVGLVFVLVILRVYTRVVCLSAYGIDDWIYVAAFVSPNRIEKRIWQS